MDRAVTTAISAASDLRASTPLYVAHGAKMDRHESGAGAETVAGPSAVVHAATYEGEAG